MRRIVILALICSILLVSCSSQSNTSVNFRFEIKQADEIVIYSVNSSYVPFEASQEEIDQLVNNLNSLSLEETDERLDVSNCFIVYLLFNDETVAHFTVDSKDVFLIDNEPLCYQPPAYTFKSYILENLYNRTIPTSLEK